MQLIVPDKVYDVAKWIAMVLFPIVIVMYSALAQTWGWPDSDKIIATLAAINAALGGILGVSSAQYYKKTNS